MTATIRRSVEAPQRMSGPASTDACLACGLSVRSCLAARRACCPDCSDRSHREGRFRAWQSASAYAYAMLCRAAGMMSDGARAGEDISWAQAERDAFWAHLLSLRLAEPERAEGLAAALHLEGES